MGSSPDMCAILKHNGEEIETIGELRKVIHKTKRKYENQSNTETEKRAAVALRWHCLLYTSPSPRDGLLSRMPSSA